MTDIAIKERTKQKRIEEAIWSKKIILAIVIMGGVILTAVIITR